MTLLLTLLAAMVLLRCVVLGVMLAGRGADSGPAFLPSIDQWPALLPFVAVEIPVFLGLLLWIRTESPWALGITGALAAIGVAQGVVNYRKDGLTLLQLDALLAALLLATIAWWVLRAESPLG